ncbi:hypothetical protein ABZW30_03970 [Kitasatospora sp. NPDC004669]|uniref:hypothetical protein n=1 Tax=Kitasatospora sp. NPDC004669 TaxID=3154555 RepID=UPI0033BE3400
MGLVIAFLVALVSVVVGITTFLIHRERARRHWTDEAEGQLIEQQRTAQAARIRATYSSVSMHHGNGLVTDDLHKHYS